jgi:hypothetical protein
MCSSSIEKRTILYKQKTEHLDRMENVRIPNEVQEIMAAYQSAGKSEVGIRFGLNQRAR